MVYIIVLVSQTASAVQWPHLSWTWAMFLAMPNLLCSLLPGQHNLVARPVLDGLTATVGVRGGGQGPLAPGPEGEEAVTLTPGATDRGYAG